MASLFCSGLNSRAGVFGTAARAPRVSPQLAAPLLRPQQQARGSLVVMAAEQKAKRTPQPVKRAELAEEHRMRNKSRKSACSTRIKKAILAAQALSKAESPSDAVAPLEKLIGEAYKEIDTAVSKGIYHKNTAARKKARVAAYKRKALVAAGLYTPAPAQ